MNPRDKAIRAWEKNPEWDTGDVVDYALKEQAWQIIKEFNEWGMFRHKPFGAFVDEMSAKYNKKQSQSEE